MNETCPDNRFELIEKYKQRLIETTNIETETDEMKVIDSILFRFWQMGWLDKLEQPEPQWVPCSERLPEERDWYLGIFKEADTGWINPIPFICDYLLGKKNKFTTNRFFFPFTILISVLFISCVSSNYIEKNHVVNIEKIKSSGTYNTEPVNFEIKNL